MRRGVRAAAALGLLLWGNAAFAHRIDEYLQATVLSIEGNRVEAAMRLIPGVLVSSAVIAAIDSNGDGAFSEEEERAYAGHVVADLTIESDGKSVRPRLVSWSFPLPAEMREGVGEIHIAFVADLPQGTGERTLILTNHHRSSGSVYLMNVTVPEDRKLSITAQKRNEQQTTYEVDYRQAESSRWAALRSRVDGSQFGSLFHLGMRHIAEGTDHLLFLLTLLLPAPLVAWHRRWGAPAGVKQSLLRILGIVTAFTVGHSITLSLAAMGAVRVPERPVEVMIAVSIFVSALHALRPIVPGKEALIAGFFGLIHGLAFAATLDRLGLGRWERMEGILAFNLGIETTQMIVVAAILPSLMLMSRTRAYPVVRVGGAVFAGVASLGWMVERVFGIASSVDRVVDAVARQAVGIAVALLLASLVCRLLLPARVRETERPRPAGAAGR